MPAASYLFPLSWHAENETKSCKRCFWLACEHRHILVGYLKLFRCMSVVIVQTKCKLNNTELFLKLFHIQSKEIGNNKYYEETQNLKNGKVRFCLNIDIRKEMEDSRLNAIKQLTTFVKGRLNFSYKSTTAANVDVMESLLPNWLKNNRIAVDKIYYLRSLFVFFLRILVFKFVSQPQKTG